MKKKTIFLECDGCLETDSELCMWEAQDLRITKDGEYLCHNCYWNSLEEGGDHLNWETELKTPGPFVEELQNQITEWMVVCFGEKIRLDRTERCDRFIEEALELIQAANYPKERIQELINYVYNRPVGEISQEVGGVCITLSALCDTFGINLQQSAEIELERIWQNIDKIREKQKSKPKNTALPQ